ncbi:hypothetical protein D3C72_2355010 [compost metagenome]
MHQLAESGLAVLWATHLVDEIAMSDQVVVLHRGRVLSNGPAAELAGDRSLAKAFLAMTADGTEATA